MMLQRVKLILLFLIFSTVVDGLIEQKGKKCKCKKELKRVTELIENVIEDVTMLNMSIFSQSYKFIPGKFSFLIFLDLYAYTACP